MEIWKDILGFEGMYQISNKGNVKSLERTTTHNRRLSEKLLKTRQDKNGYYIVTIYKNKRRYDFKVHRLVALMFIPNPKNLPLVNHKDENPANNNVDNLEWCSYSYNVNYGSRNAKASKKMKSKSYDYLKGEKNFFYGKHYHGSNSTHSKYVMQLDKQGNIITVYESGVDASIFLQVSPSAIQRCCSRKVKRIKGFELIYVDDDSLIEYFKLNNMITKIKDNSLYDRVKR